MVAIAVLALVLFAYPWLLDICTCMDDMYGPRGKIAVEQLIHIEMTAGSDDLHQSRYMEVETRYKSALKLNEDLGARLARHDWHTAQLSSEILVGLADSLAGQRRYSEAEEVLGQGAALERGPGNPMGAKELLARADAIRVQRLGKDPTSVAPDPTLIRTGERGTMRKPLTGG
jgi:hypothetical protein